MAKREILPRLTPALFQMIFESPSAIYTVNFESGSGELSVCGMKHLAGQRYATLGVVFRARLQPLLHILDKVLAKGIALRNRAYNVLVHHSWCPDTMCMNRGLRYASDHIWLHRHNTHIWICREMKACQRFGKMQRPRKIQNSGSLLHQGYIEGFQAQA